MLPVVVSAGNCKSGLWPNDLTPQLESRRLQRFLDLIAEQARIPNVDYRPPKQTKGWRPVDAVVIRNFTFATRGKIDCSRSGRLIPPGWVVVNAIRRIRCHQVRDSSIEQSLNIDRIGRIATKQKVLSHNEKISRLCGKLFGRIGNSIFVGEATIDLGLETQVRQ